MDVKIRRVEFLYTAKYLHNKYVERDSAEECIHDSSLCWHAILGKPPFDIVAGFGTAREMDEILFMNSAAVKPYFRGMGLHQRLVKARLAHARRNKLKAITYTAKSNVASANNLIDCGMRLYLPENPWVGSEYLYFIKDFS